MGADYGQGDYVICAEVDYWLFAFSWSRASSPECVAPISEWRERRFDRHWQQRRLWHGHSRFIWHSNGRRLVWSNSGYRITQQREWDVSARKSRTEWLGRHQHFADANTISIKQPESSGPSQ